MTDKTLSRTALLSAAVPRLEVFDLPALGGQVRLRQLTAGDLLALPEDVTQGAALIARSLVDEAGTRLFADDELDAIMTMRSDVVGLLVKRIRAMNFQTGDAAEALAKKLRERPDWQFAFWLARELGTSIAEIGRMSAFEWAGWQAYVKLENDVREKARLKADAARNAKGRTARMRKRR